MPTTTLATVDQVQARMGSTAFTTEITQILPGVTRAIENYCRRRLFRDTRTEYLTGDGGDALCLSLYPIESITSVTYDPLRVFTDVEALVVEQDYRYDPDNGLLYYEAGDWPADRRSIKVVYVGGYVHPVDGIGTGQTALPADITEACIQQCVHLVNRRSDYGTTGEKSGDGSVTFVDPSGLLKSVRDMLSPYVRVGM